MEPLPYPLHDPPGWCDWTSTTLAISGMRTVGQTRYLAIFPLADASAAPVLTLTCLFEAIGPSKLSVSVIGFAKVSFSMHRIGLCMSTAATGLVLDWLPPFEDGRVQNFRYSPTPL